MQNRESFITASAPLTWAWAILVAATGIGWWFGHTAHRHQDDTHLCMVGVLLTSFFKAWLIGYQFMELKRAPKWLRHTYDAWIVGVCTALLFIFLR